jgi:hypothetical protein
MSKNASLVRLRIDVAGIGVGHKNLLGSDCGAVVAEDGDQLFPNVDGFRFGLLEYSHTPLVQRAAKSPQQLAWAKTTAELIDDASRIDIFGCAAAGLQLPGREQLEERSPLIADQRHQRTEVAFLHEVIRALQAFQITLRRGSSHSATSHR